METCLILYKYMDYPDYRAVQMAEQEEYEFRKNYKNVIEKHGIEKATMLYKLDLEQEQIKANEPKQENYHGSLPYYPTQSYAHVFDSFTNEPKNTYYETRN